MAVKITEQMYDSFINNGYTEDDIKNTVNHYREQGMPDSAIFTNMNKKYREIAGIKDVVTPQIGDQPNYDAILSLVIFHVCTFLKYLVYVLVWCADALRSLSENEP